MVFVVVIKKKSSPYKEKRPQNRNLKNNANNTMYTLNIIKYK